MKKPQNRMNFEAFVYLFVYLNCKSLKIKVYCGERGIRTPGTSQFNGFQDRRNRPLCHLSLVYCYPLFVFRKGGVKGLTAAKIRFLSKYAITAYTSKEIHTDQRRDGNLPPPSVVMGFLGVNKYADAPHISEEVWGIGVWAVGRALATSSECRGAYA